MRSALLTLLLLAGSSAAAQSGLWAGVNPSRSLQQYESATLSPARIESLHALLRQPGSLGSWDCDPSELQELLRGLRLTALPVSSGNNVILAEAGRGCARGGQGSNGAMWLLRFRGATPVLLASPGAGFNGWLFSVQPATHHGYHDIVLGWHMSAADTELTYFCFDGKSYHPMGAASLLADENGNVTIVPRTK